MMTSFRRPRAALVAACFAALAAAPALAQPEGMPSKKELAAAMQAAGSPVEAHEALKPLAGTFKGEYTVYIGPGMDMTMKTDSSAEWILGDRFVQGMNRPAEGEELPFESQFTFGYDKRISKYFVFGIDSTDTYSIFAEGDYDEETKTLTLHGENLEVSLNQTLPFKFLFNMAGDKDGKPGYTSEVWFQMEGAPGADEEGWFRVMHASLTRTE